MQAASCEVLYKLMTTTEIKAHMLQDGLVDYLLNLVETYEGKEDEDFEPMVSAATKLLYSVRLPPHAEDGLPVHAVICKLMATEIRNTANAD